VKITRITTTPLALPFKEPYHWAGRVDHGATVVLVGVETDEGVFGVGESTAGFPAEAVVEALEGVAPLFLGRPVSERERLFVRARFWAASTTHPGMPTWCWPASTWRSGMPSARAPDCPRTSCSAEPSATMSIHETGGVLAFRKAAAIAEAAGVPVCLHGQSVSGITDSAQHHVGLATADLTRGNQIMHQLLIEDLVSAPDLTQHNRALGAPTAPGFGVELDRDAIARATELYRRDERFHHS
jgi:L-alanine-DL-glutamate epimerase-like enolase superfamily enzyme